MVPMRTLLILVAVALPTLLAQESKYRNVLIDPEAWTADSTSPSLGHVITILFTIKYCID